MKNLKVFNKLNIVRLLPLIIITLVIILSIIVVSTLALWQESYQDEKTTEVDIGEYNPSLKHIIFSPLDSEGVITTEQNAVSYAAVGYTGLVAELEIPSVYNSKPVTAILKDPDYESEAFFENQVITSLVVPSSVQRIASAVFANCSNLKKIVLENESEDAEAIIIEGHAFMGTSSLEEFVDNGREITGESSQIFFMSKYLS